MVFPIPPTTRLLKSSQRFAASTQQPIEATAVSLQELIRRDPRQFTRVQLRDAQDPTSSYFDTLMVDTGANRSYISGKAHVELPSTKVGVGTSTTFYGRKPTLLRKISLKLPQNTFPEQLMGVNKGFFGLLGRDLLWYYRVTLFPKRVNQAPEFLRLRDAKVPLPWLTQLAEPEFPFYATPVKLNEDKEPYRFFAETGCNQSTVSTDLVKRLSLAPPPTVSETTDTPDELVVQLARLVVQGQVVQNLPVGVNDVVKTFGCDGFLGMDVLGQFITTLDPEQMTISLRPPSKKTNRR